jgi:pyrimidine-nucleoside phosphorylase
MRAVELIARKRDGGELSTAEIEWLITGYTRGEIPDYQMAAWAMAVVWRGMNLRETTDLTLAMTRSGRMLNLSEIGPVIVDKHSTGGVGDKTTLLLAPLLAAVDLPVAKMSGRGLGFSGGTIDKLESIPGLRTIMSPDEFVGALRSVGLVIAAQTEDLAPADKRLYALRDVTATVESVPLIAASIMSKKLAAGTTCIVLDVKYGSGAFMPTPEQARNLACTMVEIGQRAGRRIRALISSMEQPLGYAVGNALEVCEAIEALTHGTPRDLVDLCLEIGAHLVLLAGRATDQPEARALLEQALASGAALEKLRQMIVFQGGNPAVLDQPDLLAAAPVVVPLPAPRSGYVASINTIELGLVLNALGGGRACKDDAIDPAVGLVLKTRLGDRVTRGAPVLYIHAASKDAAAEIAPRLIDSFTISSEPVVPPPLIADIVSSGCGDARV